MRYVGVLRKDGKEFDTSWKRADNNFSFTLGGGQVIQGWDQGVVGMKEGGRRRLIIPAELGYGATGSPPDDPGERRTRLRRRPQEGHVRQVLGPERRRGGPSAPAPILAG